uniref:Uncharacterized protein n=1 Tax=Periophthalmus magnuspinnatus TaxID=409849 RepID=A0A3B3ZLG2_9GOBI
MSPFFHSQVTMDLKEEYRAEGYVKEFTRHSTDVLLNLNELRHRNILTDATLVVGSHHLQAHCAVLVACSGFFYSLYSTRAFIHSGRGEPLLSVSLPSTLDPSSVSLLLDFMYTSRLPLTPSIAPGVLAVATYLQMDHVAQTCRDFILQSESKEPNIHTDTLLSPEHMQQEPCGRDKMTISCFTSDSRASLDPKACNWKKYKYIILNPLLTDAVKEEEQCPAANRTAPKTRTPVEAWPGEVPGQINRLHAQVSTIKRQMHKLKCKTKTSTYIVHLCAAERPYRCNVCGAQFNRPANLKTHARIHSGEKPYRCDTCGARFVQVAHLRAHVLIHTGEKPYPCHTCGTRFRHLQTLKSHLRIHTGEKPYSCEKCDLHFRHKSQLRLHLRQKHGAITNTKIRYKILTEPYQPLLQTC